MKRTMTPAQAAARIMPWIGKLVDNHGRTGILLSVDYLGWATIDCNTKVGFPIKVGANAIELVSTLEVTRS